MELEISIVIPVFNEDENISILSSAIHRAMSDTGYYYECIKIVKNPDEINHFFNSEERRYLIVKPNELKSIQKWIKVPTHMLLSESVGHRDFVFVSNKMKD